MLFLSEYDSIASVNGSDWSLGVIVIEALGFFWSVMCELGKFCRRVSDLFFQMDTFLFQNPRFSYLYSRISRFELWIASDIWLVPLVKDYYFSIIGY